MSYVNKVAFIVGNGVSRKNIDLNNLVGHGPIFGCNALYRDFEDWDYLISFDTGMVREIREQNFECKGTVVIPPVEKHYESIEYSPFRRRSNAGMIAMESAIERKHTILYCFGMDFVLEGDVSTDNVYKNTTNYGPETHATKDDNYHRIRYLKWFLDKYSDIKFIFVFPDGLKTKTIDAENFYVMDESVFIDKINH